MEVTRHTTITSRAPPASSTTQARVGAGSKARSPQQSAARKQDIVAPIQIRSCLASDQSSAISRRNRALNSLAAWRGARSSEAALSRGWWGVAGSSQEAGGRAHPISDLISCTNSPRTLSILRACRKEQGHGPTRHLTSGLLAIGMCIPTQGPSISQEGLQGTRRGTLARRSSAQLWRVKLAQKMYRKGRF